MAKLLEEVDRPRERAAAIVIPSGPAADFIERVRVASHSRVFHVSVALFLLTASLFALRSILNDVQWSDVMDQLAATPVVAVAAAFVFTAAGYFTLTFYDVLAARFLGLAIPYRILSLAAFAGFAFGQTIGFGLITGSSVRLRLLKAFGFGAFETAALTAVSASSFALGLTTLLGVALVSQPTLLSAVDHLPAWLNSAAGVAILAVVTGYAVFNARQVGSIRIGAWEMRLPGLRMTLQQIALGAIDVCCSSLALYVLLPAAAQPPILIFLGAYLAAMTLGLISHVPGGLGVFETVMLLALQQVPTQTLLGAMILYRVIYYIAPFAIAAAAVAVVEVRAGGAARRKRAAGEADATP